MCTLFFNLTDCVTGGDSNSSHGERADARSSRQHPLAALSGAACGRQARRL